MLIIIATQVQSYTFYVSNATKWTLGQVNVFIGNCTTRMLTFLLSTASIALHNITCLLDSEQHYYSSDLHEVKNFPI